MEAGDVVLGFHGPTVVDRTQQAMMGAFRFAAETSGITLRDFRLASATTSESQFAPPWLGRCQGVIVHVGRADDMTVQDVADWVISGGVPAISLAEDWSDPRIPTVLPNTAEVARQAAEHLVNLGCRSFLFFGLADATGSLLRGKFFAQELKRRRRRVTEYQFQNRLHGGFEDLETVLRDEALVEQMRTLPQPIGVWALNDVFARAIYLLCDSLDLTIPTQVRVLGSGDWPVARILSPSLSSIRLPYEEMGYQAARNLYRMLTGKRLARKRMLLNTAELVVRHSTEPASHLPGDMREALAYLERHCCAGVSVDQVADAVGMSRRTFVRHFRQSTGHSVGEEIVRLRLERATKLLVQSTFSVSRIAAMVGFEETAAFSKFFSKHVGQSPRRYRQRLQAQTSA